MHTFLHMINLIIFSRKRPMQLWALLESLPKYIKLPVVIVKIDPEYKESYDRVFKEFAYVYKIIEDKYSFEHYTIAAIGGSWIGELLTTKPIYAGFVTDDCVFYRQPEETPNISDFETFSFRYGLNTTLQNHVTGQYQPSLNLYSDQNDHIAWSPCNYQYPLNYAYTMACDGHIYTAEKLFDLCSRIKFNNSNELEGRLQPFRNEITVIKSHKQSSLVCLPLNNLSGVTQAGMFNPYSVENLNELFLQGKRIDIEKTFEKINVIGCHQEVKLEFKKI